MIGHVSKQTNRDYSGLFTYMHKKKYIEKKKERKKKCIYLEISSRRAARYPMKVKVTFSSGIVLDISPGLIRIGTPPSSAT